MTDEFGRGRHGNVPFMRKQLGMTRRVFESCAFVSQGELLQITGEGYAHNGTRGGFVLGESADRLTDGI